MRMQTPLAVLVIHRCRPPVTTLQHHQGSRIAMFTHVTLGTNDLEKARAFYNAALPALGYGNLANKDNASAGVALGLVSSC
jgi:hypothetical protein